MASALPSKQNVGSKDGINTSDDQGARETKRESRNFRGRGRGRGKTRGRGRPRDGSYSPDAFPPSMASRSRMGQTPVPSIGAPHGEEKAPPTVTLEVLNSHLEASFPSAPIAASPSEFAYVNPNRLLELGQEVYKAMKTKDHHLHLYCSEREFLIYIGWLLVKRIFDQLPFGKEEALQLFTDQIVPHPVPAPIAEYLAHITPSRSATGVTVYPSLVIPGQHMNGNWATTSTIPVTLDGLVVLPDANAPLMYPFWRLWRGMLAQGGIQPDGNAVVVNQQSMVNAVANVDRYYADNHACTAAFSCAQEDAKRVFTAQRFAELSPDGYNGAFFFDHEISRAYAYLVERVQKHYAFRPFPTDWKSSSRALLGWTEPAVAGPQPTSRPIAYRVYSHGEFSKSEYYAIQLFQFRRSFPAATGRVHNDEQNQIVARRPGSLAGPPGCEYTAARDDKAFLTFYALAYIIHAPQR